MADLARREVGVRSSATEISARTHVPPPTVAKILKALAKQLLVTSTRGSHGGYELARAALCIDLAQIIEAMEGPMALTGCSSESSECEDEPHCHLSDHWPVINKTVRSALAKVSLADISQTSDTALAAGK
jgi:FeS assembly SUF system regulator